MAWNTNDDGNGAPSPQAKRHLSEARAVQSLIRPKSEAARGSNAMVTGWLAHCRLTFSLSTPPTLGEFGRYSAGAWAAAAINYVAIAAVLFARPGTQSLAALVFASILATFFAYMGMRYRVFRGRA